MFTSKTLLFLTLLVALFVASSAQSCPLFANCDDCVGEGSGSCGWCESTNECLAGNSVGPGGVAANCTEWFYDNCLAVDCFRFTSCSTCLRDPFCGWCQTTSTCVEGLRTGPVTGSCSDYIFDRSSCPSTSTTGRRTTTTGRRATSSSTSGRRATSSSTSGRRATSSASTTGSQTTSSASTTGSQATSSTTGRQATSSSTSGRQATSSSTGRQATSSSTGRRATSTSGRRATSSSTGRRATSTSGRRASSSTGGSSVSTTSSTISSSTTGVASSGAAFSVNSASFLVAVGVVVIALVNLLF